MGQPPGVDVEIVKAGRSHDLRAIAALTILAWGRQPSEQEIEKRAARLEAELSGGNAGSHPVSFVVRKCGQPVGFAKVARDGDNPQHWWLLGLVVHPDHRRQGIGRALAVARIAHARARGATTIRSETHADNETSIRYHEGIGFKNDGPFTAADGDHKVAFSLTLD